MTPLATRLSVQCRLAEGRLARGETTLIVVKLDIIDNGGAELFPIATVVGVDQGGIERGAATDRPI